MSQQDVRLGIHLSDQIPRPVAEELSMALSWAIEKHGPLHLPNKWTLSGMLANTKLCLTPQDDGGCIITVARISEAQ